MYDVIFYVFKLLKIKIQRSEKYFSSDLKAVLFMR